MDIMSIDWKLQFKLLLKYNNNYACAGSGYDSIIPDVPQGVSDPLTEKLGVKVGQCVEQYIEAMEKVINLLSDNLKLVIFSEYLLHLNNF